METITIEISDKDYKELEEKAERIIKLEEQKYNYESEMASPYDIIKCFARMDATNTIQRIHKMMDMNISHLMKTKQDK